MAAFRTPVTATQTCSAISLRQCADDPSPETALLITCLRGLPYLVPEDVDWKVLLDLARENGVLLLVHQSMFAMGADMPGFFRIAARECQAFAEWLAEELKELLQDFRDLRIEVLPLKGPSLALTLYGDVALRASNDLDLLVRRDDFPRCETLLLGRGFIGLGPAGEHDRRFIRDELLVELHFELASPRDFPFDIDHIWSRSRPHDFRGQPVRAMSDADLVLYLCSHGLKHGFSRLIWIMDVARALRGWQPDAYEEMVQQARREGLQPYLLIGCEVVRAMFPQLLPEALDIATSASPKAVALARAAAWRLFSENRQVVINDYRGLYLQAEPHVLRRWRYRFRYLMPTYSDYQWARRHRVQSGLMVVVRPFRLLHKYGFRKALRIAFPRS
ncbi:nucleotidyltransferase domain-containing protein [Acidicapsa acidisoli]|uniref:nucleotidyltransferase domain-containing protein n=1 Tax=Acidicapsa acidisoli TaxID=1615681 RepID=UPI0021E00F24|nr:nucleotidyltransferase family protein [Acidicapsa acidisoli]